MSVAREIKQNRSQKIKKMPENDFYIVDHICGTNWRLKQRNLLKLLWVFYHPLLPANLDVSLGGFSAGQPEKKV